jgi:chorismate mutase
MVNKSLNKIRNKLDVLDDQLLLLIKKRARLVDEVLKTKKLKKEIIDKKRIFQILKRIKNKSKKAKIDHRITNKIWKTMIYAFINYEYRNFRK